MYDAMGHHFKWRYMENDVHKIVEKCLFLAWNGSQITHMRELQLVSGAVPLEPVAIDILVPLTKTTNGNQRALIIKYRLSKLTQSTPQPKST